MSRFVFRLEPVLQVREAHEQAAQRQLAEVEQARRAAEQRLAGTRRALSATLRTPRGAGFDVRAHQYLEHYREALNRRQEAQEAELANRAGMVAEKREHLIEAMQERRVLEKLRERQKFEFQSRESARRTRELDETGLMAYRLQRNLKGGG